MRENQIVSGTRLVLISCDSGLCPTLAQKTELWVAPVERRGCVVVAKKRIANIYQYIVVLDEPLNVDCWEIHESLTETYITAGIENPQQHLLLLSVEAVLNNEIVVEAKEVRTLEEERKAMWRTPNEMVMCQRCDKAQRNRSALFTCSKYNHTMCKKCLVEWDDKSNRPNMRMCADYTAEMKRYCQRAMGYEPTFLPTRVLLGFNYWLTESKERAVEEFCEYDYWVCWVCRFRDPTLRENTTARSSEKFQFIHEQLFPFGSETEASQILDSNERDLFARFGASIASPTSKVQENALKITQAVTINVYSPGAYVTHKVHCLERWTLANIFNEILEVTGTTYNSDLVMYKVDANGWEVELCDLPADESSVTAMPGGVSIMISISDLCNDDYLVLRMRTHHIIGARSHLEILGVLEPKFYDALQGICTQYSGFRKIGGDGNCYYRAVAFGLLEQLVLDGAYENFVVIRNILDTVTYAVGSTEAEYHAELMYLLSEAASGRAWSNTEQLQASFLAAASNIDAALVRACRNLLGNYLVTNEDELYNDLPLKVCILSVNEDVTDMSAYCDKYVRRMGEDAEGAFLELGLLPSLLRMGCVIHNLDLSAQKEIECPYQPIHGDCLGMVHILLRPGHYDLLYPMGASFTPPLSAPFAESEASQSKATGAKGQPLDLLTGDSEDPASHPATPAESKTADAVSPEFSNSLRELLEMCPDMTEKFAVTLLKRFDYHVGDAVNEYFTNQEAQEDNPMLLDLEAEEKYSGEVAPMHKSEPLPQSHASAAKDRIYAVLRRDMPDVSAELLHDAVHQGNADSVHSVNRYITAMSDSNVRYYDNK